MDCNLFRCVGVLFSAAVLAPLSWGAIDPHPDVILSFSAGADTNSPNANGLIVGGGTAVATLGSGGQVAVGFRDKVIIDGVGDDFRIADAGPVDEAYSVYASSDYGVTWVGPIDGVGTKTFDLGAFPSLATIKGVKYANAIKVVDKGTSPEPAPNTGLDVSSITALNSKMPIFFETIEFENSYVVSLVADGTGGSPPLLAVPEYDRTQNYKDPALGLSWTSNPSMPAAYKINQSPKLKIVFYTPNPITTATIDSSLLVSLGTGTASSSTITFTAGISAPVSITQSGTSNAVNAFLSALKVTCTVGNSTAQIEEVKLRIYYVLEKPSALYSNIGWSRAYEFFCTVGAGATTIEEFMKKITDGIFSSSWKTKQLCYVDANSTSMVYSPNAPNLIFFIAGGSAPNPVSGKIAAYNLTLMLTKLSSGLPTFESKCDELAGLISLASHAMGYPSVNVKIEDSAKALGFVGDSAIILAQPEGTVTVPAYTMLRTKSAYPAGATSSKVVYDFVFHQVATLGEVATDSSASVSQYAYHPFLKFYDSCVSQNTSSASSNEVRGRNYIPAVFSLADTSRGSTLYMYPMEIVAVQ